MTIPSFIVDAVPGYCALRRACEFLDSYAKGMQRDTKTTEFVQTVEKLIQDLVVLGKDEE